MNMIPHGHAVAVSDASRCILAPKRPPPPRSICTGYRSVPVPSNVSEWLSRPSVQLEAALEEGGESRSRLNIQPFVC